MGASRMEAERLLGLAEKLLQNRDLNSSRDFAILAQEAEPLLEGSDQILAVIDVLLAADKRINNHHDWYAILQVDRRSNDFDLIKKHYRRLALLLHPDKNRFSLADHAFRLVAEAWAVLSDQAKKAHFDKELSFFTRVDLSVPSWVQQDKLPVRRGGPGPSGRNDPRNGGNASMEDEEDENPRRRPTFWTTCPYCYYIYEYPKIYENCCLRCQNCEKSFHGVSIPSLPPLVPGQEAYHCCWGFFPMGFFVGNAGSKSAVQPSLNSPPPVSNAPVANGMHNWQPQAAPSSAASKGATPVVSNGTAPELGIVKRKRGRPRKNPLPA
ncbi:uncharacterized protein LOC129294085 [Prosopis cineraria]|uniref:uncharacterized protein LOC129294085 n=1 Tax=Prosopis cineraria TaxID=364024 RepID=UPI0024107B7B|nr:uncharacterized protein LOC129294085 [Prosopis cineraria]